MLAGVRAPDEQVRDAARDEDRAEVVVVHLALRVRWQVEGDLQQADRVDGDRQGGEDVPVPAECVGDDAAEARAACGSAVHGGAV